MELRGHIATTGLASGDSVWVRDGDHVAAGRIERVPAGLSTDEQFLVRFNGGTLRHVSPGDVHPAAVDGEATPGTPQPWWT